MLDAICQVQSRIDLTSPISTASVSVDEVHRCSYIKRFYINNEQYLTSFNVVIYCRVSNSGYQLPTLLWQLSK